MLTMNKFDLPEFEKGLHTCMVNQKGCFVVHFQLTAKVYHMVCVDGYGGFVWENEEHYLAVLNEDTPRMFSGYESGNVYLHEIEFVAKSENKA